jgi:hypothetical protein
LPKRCPPPTVNPPPAQGLPPNFIQGIKDELRLEAVVACVGFDDLLDVALRTNMAHVDTMVVVTSEKDASTRRVAEKHGATVVVSPLFERKGRVFDKGAALTHALHSCQYRGWKLMLDADIVLPAHFRRVLFNHTDLDKGAIYGADRINVIGLEELAAIQKVGQFDHTYLTLPEGARAIEKRVVHPLYGYIPVGYFQLFYGEADYVSSKGTAEYDDVLFAARWPGVRRHILPTAVVYHLCVERPVYQENWDGTRRHKRLDA